MQFKVKKYFFEPDGLISGILKYKPNILWWKKSFVSVCNVYEFLSHVPSLPTNLSQKIILKFFSIFNLNIIINNKSMMKFNFPSFIFRPLKRFPFHFPDWKHVFVEIHIIFVFVFLLMCFEFRSNFFKVCLWKKRYASWQLSMFKFVFFQESVMFFILNFTILISG